MNELNDHSTGRMVIPSVGHHSLNFLKFAVLSDRN